MEENNNPTAGLVEEADALEQERLNAEEAAFLELAEQYRIRANDKYTEHDYLLERDGVGFSPRGNVMALAAEKKAGKTWFGSAMCAALLAGQFLGMRSRIKDARCIFFDTEQDPVDGQRIQRRIHYVCGWDFEQDNDRLIIFHLREISAEQRASFVLWAIGHYKPDMAFVDGIRDLITDFNDLEQSADIIQKLMTVSTEAQCAIWTVLHVNPNSDKMRGHLGTELGNKVADIIYMTRTKNQNDEDDVTYRAEETDSRGHKDIHSIVFRIDDTTKPAIPKLLTDKEIDEIDEKRVDELRTIMDKYITDNRAFSKTKIQQMLCNGEHYGGKKAWAVIDEAIGLNVLELTVGNKFRVRHSDEALNTTQSEMPF